MMQVIEQISSDDRETHKIIVSKDSQKLQLCDTVGPDF